MDLKEIEYDGTYWLRIVFRGSSEHSNEISEFHKR
jgi:hypothetical protein